MIANAPKYILKTILQEWFSDTDLLKLISARVKIECSLQERLFVYALTSLFLKHENASNLQYRTNLLSNSSNNALFNVALRDGDFIAALQKSLRSSVADGFYRSRVLEMWTQYQITTPSVEIWPRNVGPHLIGLLDRRLMSLGEITLSAGLKIITQLMPYLETTEAQQVIDLLLTSLNDNDEDVRFTTLITISELIRKLGATEEARQFIDPVLEKLNDNDGDIRSAALTAICALILALGAMEAQQFIHPVLEQLRDHDGYVRSAALTATSTLIPELGAIEARQFIQPVLKQLHDNDGRVRSAALTAITVLISKIGTEDAEQFSKSLFTILNNDVMLGYEDVVEYPLVLDAIAELIPKLKTTAAQSFIFLVLAWLNNNDPVVNSAALYAIRVLTPKLETAAVQEFVCPVLTKLSDSDSNVRSDALTASSELISKLDAIDARRFINPVLAKLNDPDSDVRSAALETISVLISKPGVLDAQQGITPVLAKLNDNESDVRYVALKAIGELISKLETVADAQQFITPLLARLNDANKHVRYTALKAISTLIPKLGILEARQFTHPVLARLNDENAYVCHAALKAIRALILKLETADVQQFIEPVLVILNNSNDNTSYNILKVKLILSSESDPEFSQTIEQLENLYNKDRAALKTMNLLVPNANEADLPKMFAVLTRYLYDTRKVIRTHAFHALSRMIVCHPQCLHMFDGGQNPSKKMLALLKMAKMQAMIHTTSKNSSRLFLAKQNRTRTSRRGSADSQDVKNRQLSMSSQIG